ncbi:THUMP domain-containing protein 2 [Aulostomus maculatus]
MNIEHIYSRNKMAERSLVRYFCTAGSGMEPFLAEEVKMKLAARDVCQLPGKVLFSTSARITRVSELKAAERLFLLLKQDSPVTLPAHATPEMAASLLHSKLLGDRKQWSRAVMTWSCLQGELAGRKTTVNVPSCPLGVVKKRKEGRKSEEDEKCDEEFSESTGNHREEEEEEEEGRNGRLRNREQYVAQSLEKKRRGETLDRAEMTSRESCGVEAQMLAKKRKRDDEGDTMTDNNTEKWRTPVRMMEDKEEMSFSSCGQNEKTGFISETDLHGRGTPGLDCKLERRSTKINDALEKCSVEHAKTTGGGDEELTSDLLSSVPVFFRISCKCTGSLSRCLGIQEVSKVLGVGLSRLLGWKVDLKNPQLEVNVYLSDDLCLLGIPLTRLPLASRSYIKTTGLRSTVAWAMASLAQIQPGFLVVDPMCGVGTILVEAAQEHKEACFLGMDIDDEQLLKAHENVLFAALGNRMHLLKASSMVMPLPSGAVDAVVCDLPFGRKFGSKTNMAANLPLILSEMERVLCIGGTLVLLLSPQLSCLLKKLLAQRGPGPPSNLETQSETQDCPCSSSVPSKQQNVESVKGEKLSSTQDKGAQTGLQHSLPHPLSSLKHQVTLRLSLGAIDGLLHKYVKTDT